MKTIDCDFLVIGSGLAGLTTALRLRGHGRIVVVTKRSLLDSSSDRAQGGVAAVTDDTDSLANHVADTLGTGGGLSVPETVEQIVAGVSDVLALEELGVEFSRSEKDDTYDLGKEGGHSHRRILHAGDITGHEIMKVLTQEVMDSPDIELLEHSMAIDLVTTSWLNIEGANRCVGAYFQDRDSHEIKAVRAIQTILATGGSGKVYLYTSNPDVATGDGVAMGWRAGLPVVNMEMVQFHPTCLFHPEAKSFLISEAVRGEGAVLLNGSGEAFMGRFDERKELAPRDVVARAIDHEMKTRGDVCAYLDISHKSSEFIEKRFPNIFASCMKYGIDMRKEPIPVVPAAHYGCGGIAAKVDGATELKGLSAIGEVAWTGLHGANRLASNSLLEAQVCACRCAERLIEEKADQYNHSIDIPDIPDWKFGAAVPSDEAVVVEHNWNEVRTCMWDYVGIVRTNKRLERALRRICTLRREISEYYMDYLVTPDILELRNISDVAQLITRSAMLRHESRGLHYTLDYPGLASEARQTIIRDRPGGPLFEN